MNEEKIPPEESYLERVASILADKFRPVWLPLLGFLLLAASIAVGVTIGTTSFDTPASLTSTPHAAWPANLAASAQLPAPVPADVPMIYDGMEITLLSTRAYRTIERELLPPKDPAPGMIFLAMYLQVSEIRGVDHPHPFPLAWFVVLDRNGEPMKPILSGVTGRHYNNPDRIELDVLSELLVVDDTQYVMLVYEIEDVPHDVLLQWIDPAAKEASPFIVAHYPQ